MTVEINFNQHLDEFNKVTTKWDSLEVKTEEEDKALLLLASMPSPFDNIMTIRLCGKESLRVNEVVLALLMNETQRGNNGFSNYGQVAMVTKEYCRRQRWSREKE